MKRDYEKIIDAAIRQKWRVERSKKNQVKFYPPNSRVMIVASGTPSDRRAIHNLLSQLRREGFDDKRI